MIAAIGGSNYSRLCVEKGTQLQTSTLCPHLAVAETALGVAEAPTIPGNSCIHGASDFSPSFPAAKAVSKLQVHTSCPIRVLSHGFYVAVTHSTLLM